MRRRREPENASLISLLDLFACALGAAVVLGLVMMLVRDRKPVAASPSSAVMLRVAVDDADANLAFLVEPPGSKVRTVELGAAELRAGEAVACDIPDVQCIVLGWSRAGDVHLLPEGEPAQRREFVLFLSGPVMNGRWRVGVRYFSRRTDWNTWVQSAGAVPSLTLASADLYTKDGPKPCELAHSAIRPGEARLCEIVIDAR